MKKRPKKKAIKKKRPNPKFSLDEIYVELITLELKLLGLSHLFQKACTDECGRLDFDPAMNGIGELLKAQAKKIAELYPIVSEYALRS